MIKLIKNHLYAMIVGYCGRLNWHILIVVYLFITIGLYIIFRKNKKYDLTYIIVLGGYFTLLISITLRGRGRGVYSNPLDVLYTYNRLFDKEYLWAIFEILLNILLFIPEGLLLRLKMPWKKALVFVFLTTLTIETKQAVFALGRFEICDLIDNTLGGLIGMEIATVLYKLRIAWE